VVLWLVTAKAQSPCYAWVFVLVSCVFVSLHPAPRAVQTRMQVHLQVHFQSVLGGDGRALLKTEIGVKSPPDLLLPPAPCLSPFS
jgi:hypothetical protein